MNKYIAIIIGSVILLNSCSTDNGQHVQDTNEVLNLEQLEFITASPRLITEVVECTGKINVPPNQRAALYAPIGGNISEIKVLEGELVRKGQTLYKLSHQDIIKIQEEYLVALNEEKLQKTNLERKQQLFETKNISERELRQVTRDYEVARANLESLAAQLKIIGLSAAKLKQNSISSSISIKAPIAGYISKIEAVSGSYVNMNSKILTIVNTDHKHLELEVYADRISEVREGQQVSFKVAGDEKEYMGDIYLVGKEVDEQTRTVTVHAHLQNENEPLVVGSYLYAGILISSDSLMSLPETAIVNAGDSKFVLSKEGDLLKPLEVQTGKSYNGFVEVINHNELTGKNILKKEAYYYFTE